jgi:Fe-S cluster assembly ATP-binding protein
MPGLEITNLRVSAGGVPILRGVTCTVGEGELVALMGPNGSGKSTLAQVLMGHPSYEITGGQVTYQGRDLLGLKPEERARRGIFLSFQYPQEIAGVTIGNFLRTAYNATHSEGLGVADFLKLLRGKMDLLDMPADLITRSVNEGFSGGEKKRAEMLQLAVLQPRLALLDETDSGLDVDALATVARSIVTLRGQNPAMSLLLITHYRRILQHMPADRVLVMKKGRITVAGAGDLAKQIETHGYGQL